MQGRNRYKKSESITDQVVSPTYNKGTFGDFSGLRDCLKLSNGFGQTASPWSPTITFRAKSKENCDFVWMYLEIWEPIFQLAQISEALTNQTRMANTEASQNGRKLKQSVTTSNHIETRPPRPGVCKKNSSSLPENGNTCNFELWHPPHLCPND